jgi:hypothetical protein
LPEVNAKVFRAEEALGNGFELLESDCSMRTRYDWIANWKLMLMEIGWKRKLEARCSAMIFGAHCRKTRTGFVVMSAGENPGSYSGFR